MRAEHEQDRRRHQVGQERLPLVLVEAGRDELVDLLRDHREGDEQRAEQRDLHLREEIFLRRGVDELRRVAVVGGRPHVGDEQHVVDGLGEEEADDEGDDDRDQRADQARAQLDQVVEQRRTARLDLGLGLVVIAHGFGSAGAGAGSAAAAGATGAVGGAAGATGDGRRCAGVRLRIGYGSRGGAGAARFEVRA